MHPPHTSPASPNPEPSPGARRINVVASLPAIFSNLVGLTATLMMLVLLLAGSANSQSQQLTEIRWLMASVGIVGLGGVLGSAWALLRGRHSLAASLAISPAVYVIVLFITLMVGEH